MRRTSWFAWVLTTIGAVHLACSSESEAPEGREPGTEVLGVTTDRFVAVADARVEKSNPGANYGGATVLRASSSAKTYLRFDVTGLQGAVLDAKLRVFVRNGSVDGPSVYRTSGNWSEATLTWSNAPAAEGNRTHDLGAVTSGTWVTLDVKAIVTGNGTFSFVIQGTSSDGIDFDSREGANEPYLLVKTTECGDGTCHKDETCGSCAQDCGSCTGTGCGNGSCDPGETCSSCSLDCGTCSTCGNGSCDSGETCVSCTSDCGSCTSGSPHAYFDTLSARSDVQRTYSLRDQAELTEYSQHGPSGEQDINYVWPNDPDPRKQDAAKLVIPSDGSGIKSLTNRNSIYQVRVPFGQMELGHTYLVTWDAYYGNEWRDEISGLKAHKAFMLDGPDRMGGHAKIWWEVHHQYVNNTGYPVPPDDVAALNVRHYASSMQLINGVWVGVPAGPNVTSGSTSATPTTPYTQWNIQPERWVRHWQLIEYGKDPDPWRTDPPGTLMSLWAADEDRNPQALYSRLQVTLWPPGIREFWIEMNTSTNEVKPGRPNLVGYFRNVVILKDVKYEDVPKLFQRPTR